MVDAPRKLYFFKLRWKKVRNSSTGLPEVDLPLKIFFKVFFLNTDDMWLKIVFILKNGECAIKIIFLYITLNIAEYAKRRAKSTSPPRSPRSSYLRRIFLKGFFFISFSRLEMKLWPALNFTKSVFLETPRPLDGRSANRARITWRLLKQVAPSYNLAPSHLTFAVLLSIVLTAPLYFY